MLVASLGQKVLQAMDGGRIIKKERPITKQGGGTIIYWNEANIEVSREPVEINDDSVISKLIVAGNRIV